MLTQDALSDCRFCAQVSKEKGEDPIGTAGTAAHWLVIELAQPWTKELYTQDPMMVSLIKLFRQLFIRHGVSIQPILIAPDREYSQPGKTRMIYYYRSQRPFAQFEKQEYLVPEADFPKLATAIMMRLMKRPNELEAFQCYRQDTSHIREMLVCTHGNIDVACARFGQPIYKTLRQEYAAQSDDRLRVWRCSHFGGHKFAPTLVDLPDGRYWGHLEAELLDTLVYRQGDVERLRSHYRGWSGLSKFEQIVEREIWMQQGWDWLAYAVWGRTTRKGLTGIKRYLYRWLRLIPLPQVRFFVDLWTSDATWAEVQIYFTNPDQQISGMYQARVDVCGKVITAGQSPKQGEQIQLTTVPQYRVSHLKQMNPPNKRGLKGIWSRVKGMFR